jgi:hypothetical protein
VTVWLHFRFNQDFSASTCSRVVPLLDPAGLFSMVWVMNAVAVSVKASNGEYDPFAMWPRTFVPAM